MSGLNFAAGITEQAEGSIQQAIQCTDVHESPTGLAARISFTRDTILEPLPGSTEPRHRQLTFERQIDLVLGRSTRITEEMHERPVGAGDKSLPAPAPAAPQITVTATKL
jgi:hypothetical protein